jgi:hypothetical protein
MDMQMSTFDRLCNRCVFDIVWWVVKNMYWIIIGYAAIDESCKLHTNMGENGAN